MADKELLSLIIRSGDEIKDVLTLSEQLLKRYGSLNGILNCPAEQLAEENKGMTPAKAAVLKAALEAGKRATTPRISSVTVRGSADMARLIGPRMRILDREHFAAVLLNTKNKIISIDTISIGTLNSSLVHPREVFKNAIKKNAFGIILIHNHPSCDPAPSESDLKVTEEIVNVGGMLGIRVIDHIIIGGEEYYSFKEMGYLF